MGTSITADGLYPNRLANLSKMSLVNRGVSSTMLSGYYGIWQQLTTNVGTDAEVITIESINDFRANVTLGTNADPEDPGVSFYGAMKAACN